MSIPTPNPSLPASPSNHTPLIFIGVIVVVGIVGLLSYIVMSSDNNNSSRATQTNKNTAIVPPNTFKNIDSPTAPSVGPSAASAKVTVVEFLDFQCPYCKQSAPTVLALLEKYQGQPVRFVFRNLPLESIHPYAVPAAHAGLCADAQNKFLRFYSAAYQRQSEITSDNLYLIARDIGLDMTAFSSCMSQETYRAQIQQDISDAITLKATGTPTWYINGQQFEGALPLATFSTIIDQYLK